MSQFTGGTIGSYSRLWLIITGVILLGVGAVMAISLGSVPYAGGAMLMTGGFMALVGIVLIVIGIIVGRLNSGAPLNVRVDPLNLNRVAVD